MDDKKVLHFQRSLIVLGPVANGHSCGRPRQGPIKVPYNTSIKLITKLQYESEDREEVHVTRTKSNESRSRTARSYEDKGDMKEIKLSWTQIGYGAREGKYEGRVYIMHTQCWELLCAMTGGADGKLTPQAFCRGADRHFYGLDDPYRPRKSSPYQQYGSIPAWN